MDYFDIWQTWSNPPLVEKKKKPDLSGLGDPISRDRYFMWLEKIGPEYEYMSWREKKKAKVKYAKERGVTPGKIGHEREMNIFERNTPSCSSTGYTWNIPSVSNCVVSDFAMDATVTYAPMNFGCTTLAYNQKQEEVENTMSYDRTEAEKREFLSSRLYDIFENKDSELRVAFKMNDDDMPQTSKELAERLAAGKFTVKQADKESPIGYYGNIGSYIKWRDPKVPADEAGYNAAMEKLRNAKRDAGDKIAVLAIDEAFKAFEEFKNATFH